ncbi:hypothetical protein ACFL5T_05085 [Gemmatimonadota bacterium]
MGSGVHASVSTPGMTPAAAAMAQTAAVTETAAKAGKLSFLEELKRRKVLNVATVYLMTAWVVVEASRALMEDLNLDEMHVYAWVVAGLGLPIAVALAWLFEVTREGVRRTGTFEVAAATNPRWPLISRRALWLVVVIAALYVVFEVVRRVLFAPS